MAKVDIFLQGVHGIGKSLAGALLAQYKTEQGLLPACIDTDSDSATFHGFSALDVTPLRIMKGAQIDPDRVDMLMGLFASTKHGAIVDTCANAAAPLSRLLIENRVPQSLAHKGHEMTVHTVIAGGHALFDTIDGFARLVTEFPAEARFVIWLNPYWGPIEYGGKGFEHMKVYTANQASVSALIRLPLLDTDTFGACFSRMLRQRQTFNEALSQESLIVVERQRLKQVKRQIYMQLDNAMVM